jgi:CheY-like chemotaxis protein
MTNSLYKYWRGCAHGAACLRQSLIKLIRSSPLISMKHLDILLVDDDHNDCALFGIAVDRTGLKICLRTLTDGEQAIDYLEGRGIYADRSRHPVPELVVLDWNMRQTGGLEFLDWRRGSASFSSLPVVIFSGFAYKGAIETALSMGASIYIPKPLDFEDWGAVIRQVWDFGKGTKATVRSGSSWTCEGPVSLPTQ